MRSVTEVSPAEAKARPVTELVGHNPTRGPIQAQFVQSRPWLGEYQTMRSLITAIQMARRHIYLSSQYVILPDSLLRDALMEAAARGVDVRILTNSFKTCQEVGFSTSYFISLNYFAELLQAGIRLYEMNGLPEENVPQPYYHTKEFLFDGEFTAIGSFNFSIRSCYIESENLVNIFDPELTARQAELFRRRLAHEATEITPAYLRQLQAQHKNKMELARYVELLY